MPGVSYVNPFTPLTPIGAGIQNVATALFGGSSPKDDATAQASLAGADYHRAQAAKALAEKLILDQQANRGTPEYMNRTAALSTGVPLATVAAANDYIDNKNPMPPAVPGGGNLQRIYTNLAGQRMGTMDKTSTGADIATTIDKLNASNLYDRMMNGQGDVSKYGRVNYAEKGNAPFHVSREGVTDMQSGNLNLSPVGTGEVAHLKGQTAQAYETAGNQGEQAKKNKQEADKIAAGLFGPETFVDNGAGGVRPMFLGQVAPSTSFNAAPKPIAPTVTSTSVAPFKLSHDNEGNLNASIANALGYTVQNLPAEVAAAGGDYSTIRARAVEYAETPGSPAYGNVDKAAQLAIRDVAPEGVDKPFIGKNTVKGGARTGLAPIAVTGPTTRERTTAKGGAPVSSVVLQPAAPAASQRPAGKSDAQLIDEANAAVRAGKDRNAVAQRLSAWGVKVD